MLASGILGFTGVALGAFGAHALRDTLVAAGMDGTWETAVLYHLVHAVALAAISGRGDLGGFPWLRRAAACWVGGVILFSGSLYALSLSGPSWLGPVTPIGGVLLLAGWACLGWQGVRTGSRQEG